MAGPTRADNSGGELEAEPTRLPTLCVACRHRIGDDPETCTSFPAGIPEDIRVYGDDHRLSLAGEEPFELDPAKLDELNNWLVHMAPEVDSD